MLCCVRVKAAVLGPDVDEGSFQGTVQLLTLALC